VKNHAGISERQLAEALAARGRAASLADIAGWRRAGLLPQLSAHGLGPGKGRAHCWHDQDILARAELVHAEMEKTSRADAVLLSLFLTGYPVALPALRRAFAAHAKMRKPATVKAAPRAVASPLRSDAESLLLEAVLAMGGAAGVESRDFPAALKLLDRALARLGYGKRGRTEVFCRTLILLSLGLESSALLKQAADSELVEAQAWLARGLLFLAPLAAERPLLVGNFGLPLFLFILALLRSGQGTVLERIAARIEELDRPIPARPVHALRIHA
jgi:hypothetical protein